MNVLDKWFAWANKGVGEVGRSKLCHFIITSKNFPHVIFLALNIIKLLRLLSALASCQVF